jgi:adenosylcobinamide kinase/adenosylcobinamide-phosphate guanylyltransferase
MRARIAQHRRERPSSWKTIEVCRGLDRALRKECQAADLLLVDCLSLYMDNILGRKRDGRRQVRTHIQCLCEAVRDAEPSVIIVSNEVGSGIVPPYRSGREYRDLLGELNQQIAKVADRVVLMIAGFPVIVKDRSSSE